MNAMKIIAKIFLVCGVVLAVLNLILVLFGPNVGSAIRDSAVEQIQRVIPSFLEEQNDIVITPQGTVDIVYKSPKNGREITIPTEVTVETVMSDEIGYSDTIGEFIYTGTAPWGLVVFDRYTGQGMFVFTRESLPCDNFDFSKNLRMSDHEGEVRNISVYFEQKVNSDEMVTVTVTVHHPTSYDGTVFQFGQSGTAVYAEDYSAYQHTAAGVATIGDKRMKGLFTATDQ